MDNDSSTAHKYANQSHIEKRRRRRREDVVRVVVVAAFAFLEAAPWSYACGVAIAGLHHLGATCLAQWQRAFISAFPSPTTWKICHLHPPHAQTSMFHPPLAIPNCAFLSSPWWACYFAGHVDTYRSIYPEFSPSVHRVSDKATRHGQLPRPVHHQPSPSTGHLYRECTLSCLPFLATGTHRRIT